MRKILSQRAWIPRKCHLTLAQSSFSLSKHIPFSIHFQPSAYLYQPILDRKPPASKAYSNLVFGGKPVASTWTIKSRSSELRTKSKETNFKGIISSYKITYVVANPEVTLFSKEPVPGIHIDQTTDVKFVARVQRSTASSSGSAEATPYSNGKGSSWYRWEGMPEEQVSRA